MKNVAWRFVLAIFLPSLVLAGMAMHSIRNQQLALERQQILYSQKIVDSAAERIRQVLLDMQDSFGRTIESMLARRSPHQLAVVFDKELTTVWPQARVGFSVSATEGVLSPSFQGDPESRRFLEENEAFLSGREKREVYLPRSGKIEYSILKTPFFASKIEMSKVTSANVAIKENVSSVEELPSTHEFSHIIGNSTSGMLVRFPRDHLHLMVWYRSSRNPQIVFGTELDMERLIARLKPMLEIVHDSDHELCLGLLDENGKPVALSLLGYQGDWKHPFVSSKIGQMLPHWQVGAWPLNPGAAGQGAKRLRVTLGAMVGLMLLAIGAGGWLIVTDARREMRLAKQKADFVSNVSHELKTPLTSIRMFSELLTEGRAGEESKQKEYLQIISTEAARLNRLISNVLDFSRMDREGKLQKFREVDLGHLVEEVLGSFRPHWKEAGFQLEYRPINKSIQVEGDRDALARVLINLLSNAEKYGGEAKSIVVEMQMDVPERNWVSVKIGDRGMGVPFGEEEMVFEPFYRSRGAENSEIQGSGLGLALARQIARAHSGEISYHRREGGGSWFLFILPLSRTEKIS